MEKNPKQKNKKKSKDRFVNKSKDRYLVAKKNVIAKKPDDYDPSQLKDSKIFFEFRNDGKSKIDFEGYFVSRRSKYVFLRYFFKYQYLIFLYFITHYKDKNDYEKLQNDDMENNIRYEADKLCNENNLETDMQTCTFLRGNWTRGAMNSHILADAISRIDDSLLISTIKRIVDIGYDDEDVVDFETALERGIHKYIILQDAYYGAKNKECGVVYGDAEYGRAKVVSPSVLYVDFPGACPPLYRKSKKMISCCEKSTFAQLKRVVNAKRATSRLQFLTAEESETFFKTLFGMGKQYTEMGKKSFINSERNTTEKNMEILEKMSVLEKNVDAQMLEKYKVEWKKALGEWELIPEDVQEMVFEILSYLENWAKKNFQFTVQKNGKWLSFKTLTNTVKKTMNAFVYAIFYVLKNPATAQLFAKVFSYIKDNICRKISMKYFQDVSFVQEEQDQSQWGIGEWMSSLSKVVDGDTIKKGVGMLKGFMNVSAAASGGFGILIAGPMNIVLDTLSPFVVDAAKTALMKKLYSDTYKSIMIFFDFSSCIQPPTVLDYQPDKKSKSGLSVKQSVDHEVQQIIGKIDTDFANFDIKDKRYYTNHLTLSYISTKYDFNDTNSISETFKQLKDLAGREKIELSKKPASDIINIVKMRIKKYYDQEIKPKKDKKYNKKVQEKITNNVKNKFKLAEDEYEENISREENTKKKMKN